MNFYYAIITESSESLQHPASVDRILRNLRPEECPRCPPHKKENAKKKPKPDKYKSRRKGKE